MSILDELSSQVGDRTQAANLRVVAQCLEDPYLLAEIAEGLTSQQANLVGDCAEVLTETAKVQPALIVPYAGALPPLLEHRNGRVRWEAMHALALIADRVPRQIQALLPQFRAFIQHDDSVILCDGAVDALANYASLGPQEAEDVYPALCDALEALGGKQAHHAMPGLAHVARYLPVYRAAIVASLSAFQDSSRGVVRQAARRALRELGA
jgi:hypothetical protein